LQSLGQAVKNNFKDIFIAFKIILPNGEYLVFLLFCYKIYNKENYKSFSFFSGAGV
jgi:hypothetical protein